MSKSGSSRLMVVERDQLRGIATLKDLLKFIELRIELDHWREQRGWQTVSVCQPP
jgi:hypothetical protein